MLPDALPLSVPRLLACLNSHHTEPQFVSINTVFSVRIEPDNGVSLMVVPPPISSPLIHHCDRVARWACAVCMRYSDLEEFLECNNYAEVDASNEPINVVRDTIPRNCQSARKPDC